MQKVINIVQKVINTVQNVTKIVQLHLLLPAFKPVVLIVNPGPGTSHHTEPHTEPHGSRLILDGLLSALLTL